MIYLSNAFSINMLKDLYVEVVIQHQSNVAGYLAEGKFENIIGHKETDDVVRKMLENDGLIVPPGERKTVQLEMGDIMIVAQYKGPRLAEDATSLPLFADIKWYSVWVKRSSS